jgi:tetratricopeptide (TPR) repeat protein
MNNETSEIVRLTERIAKDPKSKLFVPLAEEHKKAGDLEMAIHVLLEGLQNNPGYVTARAFLGKLLFAKGDFPGAQKEFEQVVETMPDNLMAQKSLGDLCVLQNRPHDALTYYKIALSLNPRDEELASLIADIEADRDVKSKIQLSKTHSPAAPAVKEQPSASIAVPGPAPAVDSLHALNVEQVAPAAIPVAAQTAAPPLFAEIPPAPASFTSETEEPEEVLIVEPLESAAFEQEPAKPDAAVPGEQEPGPVPSVMAEGHGGLDFSLQSHEEAETVLTEDIPAEQDLFLGMDGEKRPPSMFEEAVGEAFFEPGAGEEISEKPQEKSDDFTTDTLAELYIAQGFYDKAIEIYERMLSDKPSSRGLQDKLAGVSALAAQAVAPATEEKNEKDIPSEPEAREYLPDSASSAVPEEQSVFDEPKEYRPQQDLATEGFKSETAVTEAREYVPPVQSEEIMLETEVVSEPGEFKPGGPSPEENVFGEFGEYPAGKEPGEQLPVGGDAGFEELVHVPVQESARSRPQAADFEPREYLPPKSAREPLKPAEVQLKAVQPPSPAGRKETIARLETWLSNIKKEK